MSARVTRLKFVSKASIRSSLKFAASRKCAPSTSIQVSPVKTAPAFDSSTSVMAVDWPVALTGVAGGPQPAMVPFLVAKMNEAGLFAASAKSVEPLKTMPVGAEAPGTPLAFGMATTSFTVAPAPVYKVEVPVPALFTHHGDDAPRASPHAFLRCGSTVTVDPFALAG